jgi:hypothetical protein
MSETLETPQMSSMPPMLAYTIQATSVAGGVPQIAIGQGPSQKWLTPNAPQDDSYWIAILDATDPTNKVQEFVIPGQNNATVPSGLDQYMKSPNYLFALVTQHLSTLHVPQGDFYDYLVLHGAGRELQRLEQVNTSLSCGSISRVSYLLTGQCGPPPNVAYEQGSTSDIGYILFLMSLMPMPNGQPPYTICDVNTFITRPTA